MLKQVFQAFVVLAFASSAFAQNGRTVVDEEKAQPQKDQFATYVMNGFNAGLEYSSMGADVRVKAKDNSTGISYDISGNSNGNAGALGASVNYAHLPRARAGYSFGLGIINKIENNGTAGTFKAADAFTQFRPEANVGYALSNGLYGLIGGHASIISGGITDQLAAFGLGLQATVGWVPVRNFGIDLGYYVSVHPLSAKIISDLEAQNASVDKNESYYRINQARLRTTYYF